MHDNPTEARGSMNNSRSTQIPTNYPTRTKIKKTMRRKSKITPEKEDQMWQLRNQGKTHREISEVIGVSEQTISKHLN